ncbi:hypothetical protein [Pleurochrysis sp. endemic virus 2]|nr:hypothetical protein [Pleurochrysis sp. endemic virus 2]
MTCCTQWMDVFLTQPDHVDGKRIQVVDDQFLCTVQSIRIDTSSSPRTDAVIVTTETDWILPTWTIDYASSNFSRDHFHDLEVGDLVRIGGANTNGATEYLVVLEKREVDRVYNGTRSPLPITTNSTVNVSTLTNTVSRSLNEESQNYLTTLSTSNDSYVDLNVYDRKSGIAHYAIRLNGTLNCTNLRDTLTQDAAIKSIPKADDNTYASDVAASIAVRNLVSTPHTSTTLPDEVFYYPLYVSKNFEGEHLLSKRFDSNVRQCLCVKLVGYSLVNKRQIGVQHAHELIADDYLLIHIKEIEGQVVSNNAFAQGAFAVLPVHSTRSSEDGAVAISQFDMDQGIASQNVTNTSRQIRSLTVSVTDRFGKEAHFGRLHLWFKVLVAHG